MIWRIEVFSGDNFETKELIAGIKDLGITKQVKVESKNIYLIESDCRHSLIEDITRKLLVDSVRETYTIEKGIFSTSPSPWEIIITYNPGVCDPVAISLQKALSDLSVKVKNVQRARLYKFYGLDKEEISLVAKKLLYNPLIEHIIDYQRYHQLTTLDEFAGEDYKFQLKKIKIREATEEELMKISHQGYLSLTVEEMKLIQQYFNQLGRDPTDCELETIAQTWSEHCAHKTFRGIIEYEERKEDFSLVERKVIDNLLKTTIMRATTEVNSRGCVSVFDDNSGIVRFNEKYNLCFKVETHNHPSSLEPYGGASTGMGGVIRDILGTAKGAKPVASIDVFCFSPWQISYQELPGAVLHPKRIIKGVVKGVRDYGNKMGIPTIGGAVVFDKRFLANPLVYCGTIGLLPKDKSFKEVNPEDIIVLCGARTGRDGIHGATFSSSELDERTLSLTQAVQIGNPIEEKKLMEAILEAQRKNLFSAITDCGAGGLSSAVTELARKFGAKVYLERVPLKYRGLSYTEIWISESQERMVLFTQKDKLPELEKVFRKEEVEFAVIGEVTSDKKLSLFYEGNLVCQLDMDFLFPIPRLKKKAVWIKKEEKDIKLEDKDDYNQELKKVLSSPNVACKDWIITEYDHEVQGGSILKPFLGLDRTAVSDASVIRPDLESSKGVAVGLGINPFYSDIDPYWMAALAIDEAIRNIVCVGAKLDNTYLLDNFSWGSPTDERSLAGLVRASLACYDFASQFKVPFISGKDSLYNECIIDNQRISIPGTLLISAISVIEDWKKVILNHFREEGNLIYIVGLTKPELGKSEYFRILGVEEGIVPKVEKNARQIFTKLSKAINQGLVEACHDCSEGGVGVAISEMCIGGFLGANIFLEEIPKLEKMLNYELLFSESPSRFIVEVKKENKTAFEEALIGIPFGLIGCVGGKKLAIYGRGCKEIVSMGLDELRDVWLSPFKEFR